MYKKLIAPIIVQWEVTYDCNKNCVHCYNYWRNEKTPIDKKAVFYPESSEKIVEQIIKNKVFQVVITGGEPFLVFEEMYPYLKKLRDNNVEVSINSNLAVFTDEMAIKLKEIGIDSVLVSIPASNQEIDYTITNSENAFNGTINGVKIALNHGFRLSANMVISKVNYDDIYNTAKLIKEIGIKRFSITRAVKPSNCKNFEKYRISYDEFCTLPGKLKQIKDELGLDVFSVEAYPICFKTEIELLKETGFTRGCTAGKTFCAIDPLGQVRPCILIGDNKGTDLKEAWDAMGEYRDDSMLPCECKECKYVNLCGGGCKAERLHSCGKFKTLDPYANINNIYKKTDPLVDIVEESPVIEKDRNIIVNPKLKMRKEEFGGLLYLSNRNFVPVDEKTYNFFRENNKFIFKTFVEYINDNEEGLAKTIWYLLNKGIIKYE